MTFKDQLAADLASVFFNTDEFAEAATYTPSGGAAKTIGMIPDDEVPATQSPAPANDSMTILVMASEVTDPGYGDTYLIDGVTLYHQEIVSGGSHGGVYKIRLSRSSWREIG